MKRSNQIQNLEEVVITKLVKSGNRVIGALGLSIRDGEMLVIECKGVLLAAGGLARIFKTTTNAWENIGNGYELALGAGAKLMDMEMVQFHPTGMIYPQTAEGVLVTESVRGEGGILRNIKGERFMEKYDPKMMELSTRDVVARSNYQEILAGRGTERGGVYLDISHMPRKFIEKKLPKMVQKFKDFANVDITKEPMEVAPTAHYAMGGVKVDAETCATNVEGLYAAGEIASGVHGANRLGGNSLIDIMVFGKIAGKSISKYTKTKSFRSIPQQSIKKVFPACPLQ